MASLVSLPQKEVHHEASEESNQDDQIDGPQEILLPYTLDEDGKPTPLAGVQSIFLTSTTIEIVGLQDIAQDNEEAQKTKFVPRGTILDDIQLRGAISDFHPYKAQIIGADYDPLLCRYNFDDRYDDGNNFEVAMIKSAADTWIFIEEESEKHKKRAEQESARLAAEKAIPKSMRKRAISPWLSLGSEAEIEEIIEQQWREPISMVMQQKRREFNQPINLTDRDSQELWNSSQMECRPFKDSSFSIQKLQMDVGLQAVKTMADNEVQATSLPLVPGSTQYLPVTISESNNISRPEMHLEDFLQRVLPRCEEALVQNEITNIFVDDFSSVGEEEGASTGRKENTITERQSFTDLTFSKGKLISFIQWLPHKKGVVAVSCTEPFSHQERIERAGQPTTASILVWNFKDPIHPEYVFESPFEIACFKYNPVHPDEIIAGCYNGQVIIWDISNDSERLGRTKDAKQEDGNEHAAVPTVKHRHMSSVEFSHTTMVTDIHWLNGVEVTRAGQLIKAADGTLGKECFFFVSTAMDGKVMFWDTRVEKYVKKGSKTESSGAHLAWRPVCCVPLVGNEGGDLAALQLSFSSKDLFCSHFFASSFDGEVAYADWVRPESEEHPEYTKTIGISHCGAVKCLERSPFFDDVLLSVGDWTFQIWREGHNEPLFVSPYADQYYVTAKWSPSRPGVIYLSMIGGVFEVWDLLDRTHEPSLVTTPTTSTILSISFNTSGQNSLALQLLALGDTYGVLHIMELPRNLRRPLHNEKKIVNRFLQQEMSRIEDRKSREALWKENISQDTYVSGAACDDNSDGKENKKNIDIAANSKEENEYKILEREFKLHLGL